MAQLGRAGWPATEQARGPGGADSLHATGAGGRDGTPASRARDGGPTSRPLTCRRGERYAACRGGRYSLLRRATRTVVAHFCCAASRRARRRSLSAVLMPCEQAREASPPGLEGGWNCPQAPGTRPSRQPALHTLASWAGWHLMRLTRAQMFIETLVCLSCTVAHTVGLLSE